MACVFNVLAGVCPDQRVCMCVCARACVPLAIPETLTCDVFLSCARVRLLGAGRGTPSSLHCGSTKSTIRSHPTAIRTSRRWADGTGQIVALRETGRDDGMAVSGHVNSGWNRTRLKGGRGFFSDA